MTSRLKKLLLVALAVALLAGVFVVQGSMNVDRDRFGLTRVQPLDNAPPVLAFTTVALGGFRGLISNALWIRAVELQDDDKFFEMVQLADWITKLEPHFVQVWINQAWNMAYNISVKFTDLHDRWRWLQRGIELLRDEGLRYNPNETLIYRELAWFFQHKMGANLDDANMVYKQEWANEMAAVFAKKTPNLDELIHPQTDDQKERARLLREKYKMDPALMKEVNERYGPLEWRLPEAHAIYWAVCGLKAAEKNPTKIKKDDLITLRRVIYQSMLLSFQRGRLVMNPLANAFDFGPNLDIIPKVNAAYEQAAEEDEPYRDHIQSAHRNFLRDAVYFLYEHNRMADSARWYQYLGTKYPNKTVLDGDPKSLPANVTFDEYAVRRIQEDVGETSRDRVKAAIEGFLFNAYDCLLIPGEDEHAAGYRTMAATLRETYMSKIGNDKGSTNRISMESVEELQRQVLGRLLDPQGDTPPEIRALLRQKLGMDPEPGAPTNAPPAAITNAAPAEKISNRQSGLLSQP